MLRRTTPSSRPSRSISRPAASLPGCVSLRPDRPSKPASRFASAPLEVRIAALRQGRRAFAKIFGEQERALREHLELLECHLVQAVTFVDDPLRESDREWGVTRHLARELFGRGEMR